MTNIAIVNSKSFGKYFPAHLSALKKLGNVVTLEIDPKLRSLELAERLSSYEYLIASVTPDYDAVFFNHSPQLKLIARHGLGVDNVDVTAANQANVYVTKVASLVEQEAVAEHALSLLMSLARWIPQADTSLRLRPWGQRSTYCGIELRGATVGIIGYGNIGSRLGEILVQGFGARVLVYDPNQSAEYIEAGFGQKVSLETLLSEANVISLNASANQANRALLSEAEFKQMTANVLLINTARGRLIDQQALVAALENQSIGGYAADVFEREPIEADNPLLDFDNVILTPHIGAYTYPSLKGMGNQVVNQIKAVINGEIPSEVVNEEEIK